MSDRKIFLEAYESSKKLSIEELIEKIDEMTVKVRDIRMQELGLRQGLSERKVK